MQVTRLNFFLLLCLKLSMGPLLHANNKTPSDSRSNTPYPCSQALKSAFTYATHEGAQTSFGRNKCPLERQIITWHFMKEGAHPGNFQTYKNFLEQHLDWPFSFKIRRETEKKLSAEDLTSPSSRALIHQWFHDKMPNTLAGATALIRSFLKEEKQEKKQARQFAKALWVTLDLSPEEAQTYLERFGAFLKEEDHFARARHWLQKGKIEPASESLQRISNPSVRGLLEAQIALLDSSAVAPKEVENPKKNQFHHKTARILYEKAKIHHKHDYELQLAYLQWLRRTHSDYAAPYLLRHPEMRQFSPERSWKETHILLRRALEKGKTQEARHLAQSHTLTAKSPHGKSSYADAQWLKGWLALKDARNPQQAKRLFEEVYEQVETPITRARFAFWAGLATEQIEAQNLSSDSPLTEAPDHAMEVPHKSVPHEIAFKAHQSNLPLPPYKPKYRGGHSTSTDQQSADSADKGTPYQPTQKPAYTPINKATTVRTSRDWYTLASQYFGTFYGQQAAAKLGMKEVPSPPSLASLPSRTPQQDLVKRVKKTSLFQAASTLLKADLPGHAQDFLHRLIKNSSTEIEENAVLKVVLELSPAHLVGLSKEISPKRMLYFKELYPLLSTKYSEALQIVDPSLLHAVILRESMFNPQLVSGAGAIGLTQLLPVTAQEVSKILKLPFNQEKLLSDKIYNVLIGATYLASRLEKFDGYAPLALVAYNAGIKHAYAWQELFGDPRDSRIIFLDWLESLPFGETRYYIQRVLESQKVYQCVLHQKCRTM